MSTHVVDYKKSVNLRGGVSANEKRGWVVFNLQKSASQRESGVAVFDDTRHSNSNTDGIVHFQGVPGINMSLRPSNSHFHTIVASYQSRLEPLWQRHEPEKGKR